MIFSLFSTRGNSQSVSYINSPIWIAVSRGMLFGISAAGLLAVLSGLVDLTDSGGDTAFFLIFGISEMRSMVAISPVSNT